MYRQVNIQEPMLLRTVSHAMVDAFMVSFFPYEDRLEFVKTRRIPEKPITIEAVEDWLTDEDGSDYLYLFLEDDSKAGVTPEQFLESLTLKLNFMMRCLMYEDALFTFDEFGELILNELFLSYENMLTKKAVVAGKTPLRFSHFLTDKEKNSALNYSIAYEESCFKEARENPLYEGEEITDPCATCYDDDTLYLYYPEGLPNVRTRIFNELTDPQYMTLEAEADFIGDDFIWFDNDFTFFYDYGTDLKAATDRIFLLQGTDTYPERVFYPVLANEEILPKYEKQPDLPS